MCGVGFICHIKGHGAHKIVSDARNILCNMTHRGASESHAKHLPWQVLMIDQLVRTHATEMVPA